MNSPTSLTENTQRWDRPTCCHYWVIQPAAGPLSLGVCLACGENREFKNSLGDTLWDDFNLAFRSRLDSSGDGAREPDDQENTEGDEEG